MTLSHSDASELAQLMEGTTAGALIPEIVRWGFQDLLEAGVSADVGAQLHQRCPDERATHRNGYRERVLTTQVGDLTLAIPKLRQGSFFPNWLEPRRRVDKALYAVVMEAYTGGISTRKVDALVEALGEASGISKSELSRRGTPAMPGALSPGISGDPGSARGWTSRSKPSCSGF
jgi:putative transposase